MNQWNTARLLGQLEEGRPHSISWVTPAISTMLAAYVQKNHSLRDQITFSGDDVQGYAKNMGLVDALQGRYEPPTRGDGLDGTTYSKLTRLRSYNEVDGCNQIINDLLFNQLKNDSCEFVTYLARIVGELHDNVASHAHGAGFSAAQVYGRAGDLNVQFSIADTGCGMLENVRRTDDTILSDTDAIFWCMQQGNTTAEPDDFLAQHLPEDAIVSPYPASTPFTSVENHHLGLGLWQLSQIIKFSNATLSVLSGDGIYSDGTEAPQPRIRESPFNWPGVAVEFTITVPRDGQAAISSDGGFDDLAKRFGI